MSSFPLSALEDIMAQHYTELDVVDELTTDHREALELLDRIVGSNDPTQRRELADIVITEVVRHSVAEEMYLYPVMRKYLPQGADTVEHDTEEHNHLDEVMKQLEKVDATDPTFQTLVEQMTDALRHHAQDEETEQFPELREWVPREQLIQLRTQVQSAKTIAPTRPHPHSPHDELFHMLVGPGVGLMDRVRDKLTGRATG